MGVSPVFLFLCASEGIDSDMTTDNLNEALLAVRNQLSKNMAERLRRFGFGNISAFIFRRNSCGMLGHIMWELRLSSCTCGCQKVYYCHCFVQVPAKHDLWWFGKSIGRITQPTYQIIMAEKQRYFAWNYSGTRFFGRSCYCMPCPLMCALRLNYLCVTIRSCSSVIHM